MKYIDLTCENLDCEHLCCANSADKKHLAGVAAKRAWLRDQLPSGHAFRKLDARGKVFIECAPAERAWASVEGDNWLYIHCLWVSGSFKGQGHGRALIESCIADARARGMAGVCAMAGQKKMPFLSDGKFLRRFGFAPADALGGIELLALSFDGGVPRFADAARAMRIESGALTIYYSPQCPYTADCAAQCRAYCEREGIELHLIPVRSAAEAKAVPAPFNNWVTFVGGRFAGAHLLNESYLAKLLGR